MPISDIQPTQDIFKIFDSKNKAAEAIFVDPSVVLDIRKVKSNTPTRTEGTSSENLEPGSKSYYSNTPNTIAPGTTATTIDPGANSSNEITSLGTSGENTTASSSTTTSPVTNPSNNGPLINGRPASETDTKTTQLALQSEADKSAVVTPVNKAFPYISPLSSTNFAGLKPINPLGIPKYGTSNSLYNPSLLNDEGIIYLRQYISADDETTGAVWRFQYAPQISYTRSSTFQEDKSWGTNVQPSHFNNTSGKSIQISGAILEGLTIGSTVTNAVVALETLMSVVNPDNQLQVAPYAYRLIVGSRTLKEPISDKHSPFIIESITVKEEMYDSAGELLMVKIDMNLKEVPYYQINDGRKLLLVTKEVVDAGEEVCTTITKQIAEISALVKTREGKNLETYKLAEGGAKGKLSEAAKTMKVTHAKTIETNCAADSEAYAKLAKLLREYTKEKCTLNKDTSGLDIIIKQFAYKSGIYEVMKGRKLEYSASWVDSPVYDAEGNTVKILDRLKQLNITPTTLDSPVINYINVLNRSFTGFTNDKITDYLPSCPHIVCIDKSNQGNTNDANLKYAIEIAEKILNSPDPKKLLQGFSEGSIAEITAARKSVFNGKGKTKGFFKVPGLATDPAFYNPCGVYNTGIVANPTDSTPQSTAADVGLSTNGRIDNKAYDQFLSIISNRKGQDLYSFAHKTNRVNDLRSDHGGAQACLCGLYLYEAINQDIAQATKSSCSVNAAKERRFDIYQDIVNRLSALYTLNTKKYKLAASSVTNEISDIDKESCGNNRKSTGYVDCRSSYCLAYTVKKIVGLFDDYGKLENPIKSVTDAIK